MYLKAFVHSQPLDEPSPNFIHMANSYIIFQDLLLR